MLIFRARILDASYGEVGISKKYGHEFEFDYQDVGGISIDKHGTAITEEALRKYAAWDVLPDICLRK